VIRVEREIEVDRPADVVFERLVRIEDLPRWQPAITEAGLTSPGPIGAESTIRILAVAAGQTIEALGTVTEFERPRRVALKATASSADVTADVTVEPIDDASSRLSIVTEIALGGMLRFVEGMVRARVEAEAPAAAAAAKSWLESAG
jgi:carbon monoxide dehydrogenase subunit G